MAYNFLVYKSLYVFPCHCAPILRAELSDTLEIWVDVWKLRLQVSYTSWYHFL